MIEDSAETFHDIHNEEIKSSTQELHKPANAENKTKNVKGKNPRIINGHRYLRKDFNKKTGIM